MCGRGTWNLSELLASRECSCVALWNAGKVKRAVSLHVFPSVFVLALRRAYRALVVLEERLSYDAHFGLPLNLTRGGGLR